MRKITDREILDTVQMVSAQNAGKTDSERRMFALMYNVAAMAGKQLRFIKWANGITAIADSDPSDSTWDALIVRTYRQACKGKRGATFAGK
ncbi:MAG: hypothetical protein NT123_22580 [Proteobacteria bacterium]|nr:hypothetical protein [Pseudomonadota bacterium]